ncbi:DNA ligase D [Halobacillus litoralis]|uniref:DNA ligase D n=1 Tax=Halobacillus litoralis TaxID=45668 RepID=UPI001CFC6D2D|nr:DNA ligase D [Halobacillus litoralis]
MKRPMLLTSVDDLPDGKDWIYEVKYDGFRVILEATKESVTLTSRNGKDLSDRFPEISTLTFPDSFIPFTLDGELVILDTPYQANFQQLQKRGRMRKAERIKSAAADRPATFIAFDLLNNPDLPLSKRKKHLRKLIQDLNQPVIQEIETFEDLSKLMEAALLHRSEGIVAKRKKSLYRFGDRGQQWLKWKQWKDISGYLLRFNPDNGYYDMGVQKEGEDRPLGRFKHGLTDEETETLHSFFKEHGEKKKGKWELTPSVCVDIHCLDAEGGEFREPIFHQFRFDLSPQECTDEKLSWDLSLFPPEFEPSHVDKNLWPGVSKQDYLIYIRRIAPYLLPYIREKKLTMIRYPDGVHKESFFQKHYPDYAPEHLNMWTEDGEQYILCDKLHSLLWLANQGALEFHIPFEKAGAAEPDEIVLDLDPPGREHFRLAVTAAQMSKHLLDELGVISFVKTSGNKGMQIHIPIKEGSLDYNETRKVTETLAGLLVKEEPDLFTIERLKKKRGNRLYIDYVQHAEGKTIIAPYSARATETANIAAPVFWDEVNDDLSPETFTIKTVLSRLTHKGDPFRNYEQARHLQPIQKLKQLLH